MFTKSIYYFTGVCKLTSWKINKMHVFVIIIINENFMNTLKQNMNHIE